MIAFCKSAATYISSIDGIYCIQFLLNPTEHIFAYQFYIYWVDSQYALGDVLLIRTICKMDKHYCDRIYAQD